MEDFLLLEDQFSTEEKLIRDSVKNWLAAEVMGHLLQAFEESSFSRKWIDQLAELGILGMTLPTEYGCAQSSYTAYGLVCQELEYADSGLRSFVSVHSSLCMHPIFTFGSDQQKQHFLPLMAKAKKIGCFGLTEPDAGSDPANMRTTAKKVASGWILNGSKMWITNATLADLAIVWARTDQGIRGFIVEKDFKGFSSEKIQHKMSMRASDTGELIFKDCFVPDDHYLPGSEIGIRAPLACLTKARYGIAWGVVGAALACLQTTIHYVKERKQFNRSVASFQLVQKDLADMFTEIVKMQAFNLQLGRLADAEKVTPVMVSMAKMNAVRESLIIARKCRNLLGANGISLEYSVIRHMLNLESVFTYEGTDNIHHLILGKYLTGIDAFG